MKAGTPFRRAHVLMAAIQACLSLPQVHAQQAAIAALGPHESRGKGRGTRNRAAPGAGMAAHRAAMKRRNVLRHRARSRA